MVFVGPSPESITAMGLKHRARDLAHQTGVPIVPGSSLLESDSQAVDESKKIGFPVQSSTEMSGCFS